MKKDREIESRLVKSVMVYLVVDSLTKICTLDNEMIIVLIAIVLIGVILTLKVFD